jgi:hypothetical protein
LAQSLLEILTLALRTGLNLLPVEDPACGEGVAVRRDREDFLAGVAKRDKVRAAIDRTD